MSLIWHNPPGRAWGDLADAYTEAIEEALYRLAQRYAAEIEAWMKDNAPWTDRTGNARQTLYSEAERLVEGAVEIVLAHGMEYGIFLELSNGGTYAVIGPALDTFVPLIWQDVQALLS